MDDINVVVVVVLTVVVLVVVVLKFILDELAVNTSKSAIIDLVFVK